MNGDDRRCYLMGLVLPAVLAEHFRRAAGGFHSFTTFDAGEEALAIVDLAAHRLDLPAPAPGKNSAA